MLPTSKILVFATLAISASFAFHGCGDTMPSRSDDFVRIRNFATTPVPGAQEKEPLIPVPLIDQLEAGSCHGWGLGLYSWNQTSSWRTSKSTIVDFLLHPPSRAISCGETYINVGDYTNADRIYNPEALYAFMINVRRTGNSRLIWLTYGDVVMRNGVACATFATTFFNWVLSMTPSEAMAIAPFGIAYDVEHIGSSAIRDTLIYCQELKAQVVASHFGGDASQLLVQWTIEGEEKPVDTDAIMTYADRALMMNYRNHLTSSPLDPSGSDTLLTRLMNFMFTRQCKRCLDDDYAIANYKAKITIMVEAACKVGRSCNKISFCAFDGNDGWGTGSPVQYLLDTLTDFQRAMVGPNGMRKDQFERLFALDAMWAVHDFEWFTCYFADPAIADPMCKGYESYARQCKTQ